MFDSRHHVDWRFQPPQKQVVFGSLSPGMIEHRLKKHPVCRDYHPKYVC